MADEPNVELSMTYEKKKKQKLLHIFVLVLATQKSAFGLHKSYKLLGRGSKT
jgi:hypothetical protein